MGCRNGSKNQDPGWAYECNKKAIYSLDSKRILSISYDKTISEWNTETGHWLHNNQKNNLALLGDNNTNEIESIDLVCDRNKIRVRDAIGKIKMTLTHVSGLWIQGCSFKDLESKKEWSEESLALLKQNGGKM